MQGTYTVTKAQQARSYQGKHGELVVWQVRLDGAATAQTDGVFELHKKPGNEPKPGDSLEVERSQEGEFDGAPFVRLFLAKPQQGAQRSGGFQGGSDERGESIERQVAAKVAGEMAAALAAAPSATPNPVVAAANFEGFFDAVIAKIQGSAATQQTANGGGGEVPADLSGLAPASPAAGPAGVTDGDDIPFRSLPIRDRSSFRRDLFAGDRWIA